MRRTVLEPEHEQFREVVREFSRGRSRRTRSPGRSRHRRPWGVPVGRQARRVGQGFCHL